MLLFPISSCTRDVVCGQRDAATTLFGCCFVAKSISLFTGCSAKYSKNWSISLIRTPFLSISRTKTVKLSKEGFFYSCPLPPERPHSELLQTCPPLACPPPPPKQSPKLPTLLRRRDRDTLRVYRDGRVAHSGSVLALEGEASAVNTDRFQVDAITGAVDGLQLSPNRDVRNVTDRGHCDIIFTTLSKMGPCFPPVIMASCASTVSAIFSALFSEVNFCKF